MDTHIDACDYAKCLTISIGNILVLLVNAMVTISAIILIAGARTMVITTTIKELQYFGKYNEIFVLSLLILFTNIVAKKLFSFLIDRNKKVKGNN